MRDAYALVEQEQLLSDLSVWGGYRLLVDLCQELLPQTEWQPEPEQMSRVYLFLGEAYRVLGKKPQVLEYHQQALSIFQQIGDREGEGSTQWNLGVLVLSQHHYDFALAVLLLARQCFEEIASPQQDEVESEIKYLRQAIGQQRFTALQEEVEPRLQQIVEQGFSAKQTQYEKEEDAQQASSATSHNHGGFSLLGRIIGKILRPKKSGK